MSANRMAIERRDDAYVIAFMESRIVDPLTIAEINNSLKELAEKAGMPKFVIDFANVTHISSAMIGVLMTLNKEAKKQGGEIRVSGVNSNIEQVFKLTRLDKLMKMYPDSDKALVKF